jgi:hypothetical protein
MEEINKTLLLAPNYVKDVNVKFSPTFIVDGRDRKTLTIEIEADVEEFDTLRNMPGMDDYQFVSFLSPCLQVSVFKTLTQGAGKKVPVNEVKIEDDYGYKDDYGLQELVDALKNGLQ